MFIVADLVSLSDAKWIKARQIVIQNKLQNHFLNSTISPLKLFLFVCDDALRPS